VSFLSQEQTVVYASPPDTFVVKKNLSKHVETSIGTRWASRTYGFEIQTSETGGNSAVGVNIGNTGF
jgi:hypothetical protein